MTVFRGPVAICGVALSMTFVFAAPVFATTRTCSEELPVVKAEIDAMTSNADKNVAQHQYERAQERLAAGKEKSCLRYLGSARAAVDAWRMHDD